MEKPKKSFKKFQKTWKSEFYQKIAKICDIKKLKTIPWHMKIFQQLIHYL